MNRYCDLWEPLSTWNAALAYPMTSLILSEMAVTYAVADITWWTSPGPLREFRTASNERAGPGNEASIMMHAGVVLQATAISAAEQEEYDLWD